MKQVIVSEKVQSGGLRRIVVLQRQEKQVPRGLKSGRDDKIKDLSAQLKLRPFKTGANESSSTSCESGALSKQFQALGALRQFAAITQQVAQFFRRTCGCILIGRLVIVIVLLWTSDGRLCQKIFQRLQPQHLGLKDAAEVA